MTKGRAGFIFTIGLAACAGGASPPPEPQEEASGGSGAFAPTTLRSGAGGSGTNPMAGGGGSFALPPGPTGDGGKGGGAAGALPGDAMGGLGGGTGGAGGMRPPTVDTGRAPTNDTGSPLLVSDGGSAGTTPVVFGDSNCQGLMVCDGFEGNEIDNKLWNAPKSGAQISTDKPARGKGSLKLDSTGGSATLNLKSFPAALKEHFFGRLFLWSQDPKPTFGGQGFFAHVEFFRATRSMEYIGYALGVVGDLRITSPSDDALSIHSFDTMKWACVEWEFDAKAHKVVAWWNDGKKEVMVDNSKKAPGRWSFANGTTFETAQLGIIPVTSGSTPLHVWIDEFAMDAQRIGCAR